MKKWPPRHTKIRENLTYTLGLLKTEEAVPHFINTLKHTDQHTESPASGTEQTVLLRKQKEEAIKALGRIGGAALEALNELCSYVDHPASILQTTLAWSLGELGQAQRGLYELSEILHYLIRKQD
jgi:HEAT repeat protein